MQKERSDIDFQVGKTYPFVVNTIHDDFCELLDESGFQVYLQHTEKFNLVKGQRIECRVKAYTQKRPRIELVDTADFDKDKTKLNLDTVSEIIAGITTEWDTATFASLLMMNEVEDQSFETECREWIHNLKQDSQDLENIKTDCTRFMEESDFFGLCNPIERDHYQQRLTLLIELLEYYIEANKLTAGNKAADFVAGILDKLEKTGYIFHPQKNFNIMSCLLLNDASLIEGSISRLFNIIRLWPLDIWVREPFKSTLIKVLNVYIEDNIWKVDRQDDNDTLVKSLVQAIAILLLLAGNDDNSNPSLPDERLNLARLCVLSTYQELYHNQEVLTLAMNCLTGRRYYKPTYGLADTEGNRVPFMLKTHLPHSNPWPIETTSSFISGKRRLVLSPDGISLFSGDVKEKPLLPASLGLWQNMQVYADKRQMKSTLVGKINISDCKRLWEDIELDLFHQTKHTIKAMTTPVAAPKHKVGDHVTINITRIEEGTKSKAYCCFKGENEECGYINATDTVSYMKELYLWMFQDDFTHKPFALEAVIEEVLGDGKFRFSMQELIREYVCSNLKPGDTITCSLGASRGEGDQPNITPAITEFGESVALGGYSDVPLSKDDIVSATYQSTGTGNFHIYCTINGRVTGNKVNVARAFHELMMGYRWGDDNETTPVQVEEKQPEQTQDDDFEQNDRMLDAAYIKEVIRIIDRMAFTDSDYVRSYNYLAFARVICRLIGWESQADYYRGRLQLIYLLYDFAVNDRVDTEKLDTLQNTSPDLFNFDTAMTEKFKQLRIVSYMGTRDNDTELWRYRSLEQGDTRKVASLAMAYNILLENHLTTQANDVQNRIKDSLNLKGYESNLDTYGTGIESKTVEYKTSIVFPPDNNMKPDIRRQMNNILAVIVSFLNTDGGTLYIGANNSGAGVGVDNDLEYHEFNGDRDKYMLYISNKVSEHFGQYVKTYVNMHWEKGEKSGKEVLVVEVEPYMNGLHLEGVYFYRDDNGKRRLTKADFEKYNERRQQRLLIEKEKINAASTAIALDQPMRQVQTTATQAKPAGDNIKTSSTRKNVLVEDGSGFYRPFVACLKFLDKGKFCKISDYDYDDSTQLTLAVYDEETQDGILVLGYEDGSVTKVPVRELLKFDDYKEYNRNTSSRLVFATIAFDTDGLVSVLHEKAKDRVVVRVDTLSSIEPGRLADNGQKLYNDGLSKATLDFEIMAAENLEAAANITDKGDKVLGMPLKTTPSDLKKLLAKCGIDEDNYKE